MTFLLGDAAADVLDLGYGESPGPVLVYGLPEQAPDQRRGGNVLGVGASAQLRVQFPVDPQVQRRVQGAGLLSDFGFGGLGLLSWRRHRQ